jgi:VanZ family protein
MVAIFVISSIAQQDLPKFTEKVSDKILHFLVFFILAWLMMRGFMYSVKGFLNKNAFWLASGFTSLYGIIDELHQKLVPGRYSSFSDWLADTAGALLAVLVFSFYWRYRNKRAGSVPLEQKNSQ